MAKKSPTKRKPSTKGKGKAPKSKGVTLPPLPKNMPKGKVAKAVMSPKQMQQLLLLSKQRNGATPKEFAPIAFADSDGWNKECRTGTGPLGKDIYLVKGGAMNLTAGAALGKLAKAGWAEPVEEGRAKRYFVTPAGANQYRDDLVLYKKASASRRKAPAPK